MREPASIVHLNGHHDLNFCGRYETPILSSALLLLNEGPPYAPASFRP